MDIRLAKVHIVRGSSPIDIVLTAMAIHLAI